MPITLDNCPFCKSEAAMETIGSDNDMFFVACSNSSICGCGTRIMTTVDEAASVWNKRILPSDPICLGCGNTEFFICGDKDCLIKSIKEAGRN